MVTPRPLLHVKHVRKVINNIICENKENYIINFDKKTEFGRILKYVAYGCLFLYVLYIIWKVRRFYLKDERLKAKYKIKDNEKEDQKNKKEELQKQDGEFHNIEDIAIQKEDEEVKDLDVPMTNR